VAHDFCRKVILRENFKPVWIYAKNKNAFWVYSLPSTTRVTKNCKVNGTTMSKDFILTGAGILQEDTNCQYFSEAFILLPVADSYTNFTLTAGHVAAPDLPELISPKENHQLEEYSQETNATLRTLESLMRRGTSTNQEKYVELSHLLQTIEQNRSNQKTTTWYTSSIIFILIVMITFLTLKYWRRLRSTSCATKLPWQNGTHSSPDTRLRTAPQPRKREHLQLSRISKEADSAINEEKLPLNVTTYSNATPLQVDPACLATANKQLSEGTRKESRPTTEIEDQKFSLPGLLQLPTKK
jgi:hypothetical protein